MNDHILTDHGFHFKGAASSTTQFIQSRIMEDLCGWRVYYLYNSYPLRYTSVNLINLNYDLWYQKPVDIMCCEMARNSMSLTARRAILAVYFQNMTSRENNAPIDR
jgi:hypothetical protein